MKIEVQWSPSCPHREEIERVLQEAMQEVGVTDTVSYVEISSPEEAIIKKCLGSPTIRVNGFDTEYGNREPDETTPGCRYFNTPDGWLPIPPKDFIVRALREGTSAG